MKRRAFTLVELLAVLAVLAVLAGVLLPVIARAQRRGQQAVCVSNLRQLGNAVMLYAQDNDSRFPFGGDPEDLHTTTWKKPYDGRYWADAQALRPLPEVMKSYAPAKLWSCPSNRGFDKAGAFQDWPLVARPSSFAAFGTSYFYHTDLALRRKTLERQKAWDKKAPHTMRGPSEVSLLSDGHGSWHGGEEKAQQRRNVLFVDGHVKSMPQLAFEENWRFTFTPPEAP